jgi:hypothetical protein
MANNSLSDLKLAIVSILRKRTELMTTTEILQEIESQGHTVSLEQINQVLDYNNMFTQNNQNPSKWKLCLDETLNKHQLAVEKTRMELQQIILLQENKIKEIRAGVTHLLNLLNKSDST